MKVNKCTQWKLNLCCIILQASWGLQPLLPVGHEASARKQLSLLFIYSNEHINVMPDYHRQGLRLGLVGEWTTKSPLRWWKFSIVQYFILSKHKLYLFLTTWFCRHDFVSCTVLFVCCAFCSGYTPLLYDLIVRLKYNKIDHSRSIKSTETSTLYSITEKPINC